MTMHLASVDLGAGVRAVFTGRCDDAPEAVGARGNLSHRRAHRPSRLAADRATAASAIGVDDRDVVRLQQVHGRDVVVVVVDTPRGAELGPADAAVTTVPGQALAVLVADCVPVLFASDDAVGVAHAGRGGVMLDVVGATVEVMRAHGHGEIRAVVGPAIHGCCYEVQDWLRDEVSAQHPAAHATTTWGTPSLDLPTAVLTQLEAVDVEATDVGACTHCGPHWFSHRRDGASAGRQAGLVVRSRPSAPVAVS